VNEPRTTFIQIGQQTSAQANPGFQALIAAGDLQAALELARGQIQRGAQIIDVNVDDDGSDPEQAMARFLRGVASAPDIARVPVMIDSARWSVVEAGLKCVQGRAIVRSISFEHGEEQLLAVAHKIRRYGAAVVVLARDERGSADTVERKVAICGRAYDLLTQNAGFDPEDIIFDPGVHPSELAFIEATWQIKEWLPGTSVLADAAEASLRFQRPRAPGTIRAAVQSVFLEHAIAAGLDMGIVELDELTPYEELGVELRARVEDAVLERRPDAAARLYELAAAGD
jgi:5-methyltetrahydrofolate--homocysteine methyltransferase